MLASKRFLRIFLLTLISVAACVFAGPAMSQDTVLESTNLEQTTLLQDTGLDIDDSVSLDARMYANDMGVPLQEAIRRMNLQERFNDDLADLEAELRENEADTFAGLWIEHEPEYRFVVLFTEGGEQTIRPYIEGDPVAEFIEVRSGANATLDELEAAQARAWNLARFLGVDAETLIDVTSNLAYLRVIDRSVLDTALREVNLTLPDNVAVVEVENFLESSANIYAGLKIVPPSGLYCTSGFSVIHTTTGRGGMTTAGHCADENNNVMYYRGQYLPWQNGSQTGPYDLQWHTTPNYSDQPWARYPDADGHRVIIGARGRFEQDVGTYVCHFGQGGAEPEYKCGTIRSRYFGGVEGNDVTATRIYVVNNNTDLSDFGDSGGPWYTQDGKTALGIHEAGDSNEAAYMSITYFNDDGPKDFNLVVRKG